MHQHNFDWNRLSECFDAWSESRLFDSFFRSLLLMYFLSLACLAVQAFKLQKGARRRNAGIRIVRTCTRGAPIWLALAVALHCLPAGHAMGQCGTPSASVRTSFETHNEARAETPHPPRNQHCSWPGSPAYHPAHLRRPGAFATDGDLSCQGLPIPGGNEVCDFLRWS